MGNITQYISEGLLQASQVAEHKLVYSPEGQEGIHISPQWHPIWLSALSSILYGYNLLPMSKDLHNFLLRGVHFSPSWHTTSISLIIVT